MMYRAVGKRFLDFFAALILLACLSPLFLVIFITLAIYYKGNPFFLQERPGYKGAIFSVIKFKSMHTRYGPDGNLLPDIERITPIGIFLRKASLDELPQLINIIKGDMSFIGPRPLLVRYLPYYSKREFKRHDVRPGMTGLAQISGRNNLNWKERLELDARYAESLSFSLDVQIFFKTILKVLKGSDIRVIPSGKSFDAYKRSQESQPSQNLASDTENLVKP